LTKTQYLKLF